MDADQAAASAPRTDPPAPLLRRLSPRGADTGAEEFVQTLALGSSHSQAATRPRVLLNMASTVDGRTTLGGRSGGISNRADRALFHALRASVDAVLVGAGTARTERYGAIIRDAATRERREARGLRAQPLACIVSASVTLPGDLPLLADADSTVVILTASDSELPPASASVEYVRAARGSELDLGLALAELRARHSVETLLCEGGPHLNSALLRAGLVDELFLSFAPKVAGGGEDAAPLRIVAGPELEPPIALELLSALESESQLFLRYAVCDSAAARVSAETTRSKSLAS
jgi:riboflavin-specific deaminase-like protein